MHVILRPFFRSKFILRPAFSEKFILRPAGNACYFAFVQIMSLFLGMRPYVGADYTDLTSASIMSISISHKNFISRVKS